MSYNGGEPRFWFDDPNALLDRSHVLEIWPEPSMSFERKLNAISRAILGMMLVGSLVAKRRDLIVTSAAVSLLGLVVLYRMKNRSRGSTQPSDTEGFLNLLQSRDDHAEGGTDAATCGCSDTREEEEEKVKENGWVHTDVERDAHPSAHVSAETHEMYEKNPFGNVLVPDYGTTAVEEGGAPPSSSEIYEMVKRNAARTFDVEAERAQEAEMAKEEERDIKDKLFMNLGDNYVFENSMRNYVTNPCTKVVNDQDGFARFCYGEMRSQKEDGIVAAA